MSDLILTALRRYGEYQASIFALYAIDGRVRSRFCSPTFTSRTKTVPLGRGNSIVSGPNTVHHRVILVKNVVLTLWL